MSKTRKILSVVLAAALVFALAIPAFAVSSVNFESAADAATYTQEWSLAEPVFIEDGDETFPDHAGEYYIDVVLKTNYPTGAVEFEVETTGDVQVESAEPYEYYSYINEEDERCWDADFRFDNNKAVLVPDSSSVEDAVVFTQIDEDEAEVGFSIVTIFVSGTNGTVAIKNDPKNATNTGGTLIAARLNPAKITGNMYVGQKATVGAAVTIGEAAEAPTLAVIDGTAGVINTDITEYITEDGESIAINGFVYGVEIEDGEGIADVFEVVGDGTMEVLANFNDCDYGTGAYVNVLDSSENVVETYIFILFGDIDGNGMVDGGDSFLIEAHDGYAFDEDDGQITDSAVLFAGDVDITGGVDGGDSFLVEAHDGYAYDEIDGRMQQADVVALM